MDWMNWKTWSVIGLILVAAFAIYTFAGTQNTHVETAPSHPTTPRVTNPQASVPGVPTVHMEYLNPPSGRYRTDRNLFAYREPPPPPPPAPPAPPPDKDKDNVPDMQDNCPDKANSDQTDIDQNGVGDACQTTTPIPPTPPPPPPPRPPEFTMKYIGTFGSPTNPIATFSGNGEIINAHVGDTIEGKFIVRAIGVESVDIGFVGFPPDEKKRVPLGQ